MKTAQQIEVDLEAIAKRAEAAINSWYEKHFHSHVTKGTPAISSAEKDELHKAVAAAVQPKAPEPAQTSEED